MKLKIACDAVLCLLLATSAADAFDNCIYRGRTGPIVHYFCPSPSSTKALEPLPQVTSSSAERAPLAKIMPPAISRPDEVPPYRGEPLREIAETSARRYGVNPRLVEAVITIESGWNPRAVSRKRARGLMQLMPETASALGVQNVFDPAENIDGGVRHLRDLLREFQRVDLALAAYNAGRDAVHTYGGVPPYPETQEYVRQVLAHYGRSATERTP